MTTTATLLYQDYSAAKTAYGNVASLVYLVEGLTQGTTDPTEALTAAAGLVIGSSFPGGGMPGAICQDIRVLRRLGPTKALVRSGFTYRRWGAIVYPVTTFSSSSWSDFEIPNLHVITSPPPLRDNWVHHKPMRATRVYVTRRVRITVAGAITDSTIDFVNSQTGALYVFDMIPYILSGTRITSNPYSSSSSTIEYGFHTSSAIAGRPLGTPNNLSDCAIPDLPMLSEYLYNIDDSPVVITASDPLNTYPIGLALPGL